MRKTDGRSKDDAPSMHGYSLRSDFTRRECMKLAASASAIAFAPGSMRGVQPSRAAASSAPGEALPPEWTGHNRKLGEYFRDNGYPAYEPHPRYLGELTGSWYEIGRQYGERAGDLTWAKPATIAPNTMCPRNHPYAPCWPNLT